MSHSSSQEEDLMTRLAWLAAEVSPSPDDASTRFAQKLKMRQVY